MSARKGGRLQREAIVEASHGSFLLGPWSLGLLSHGRGEREREKAREACFGKMSLETSKNP